MPESVRAWAPSRALERARRDRGIGPATAVVMAALVVLAYAAAVGIERLAGRTGPPGLVVSVVVTAIVAVAFEPIRMRTRKLLTRLTHADGPSRAQVLAGFTEAVGGAYPVTELPGRIAAVVGEGTGALSTQVWLMVNGRLELAATWSRDDPSPGIGGPDGAAAAGTDRHSVEVRDQGELLGRLTITTEHGHRLTTVERRLVDGVAAQAGLLLRVAGLRVELQRRLDELQRREVQLRRARRDLVARHDAERKRLERDIHDGAQQEVIALLVNLRLVRTLLDRAPDRAVGLLGAQADAFRSTIRTLTELAHGLYPPVLVERGPVAALRAAARHSPVTVELSADEIPRLAVELEATVYFGVLEAIQNAAKHAAATTIRVDIAGSDGRLRIAVADDGVGFDLGRVTAGRGLANVRDRAESVGGSLRLTSRPGAGTRLDIELPVIEPPDPGAG